MRPKPVNMAFAMEPALKNLRDNFYLHFAALIAAVFVLCGKSVPSSNEYSYLLRLVKTYHPQFLLNDITFSTPANEHWLFNHLFGVLTFAFPIEMIGWIGRLSCWAILIYALMRLGRYWKIPLWMISGAIFLWLCAGQSIVADEWMIGGFEAKCVAYCCLLFALDGFCKGREIVPSILLGLTFSFHPAVGLWGIPAAIIALAVFRWEFTRIIKITVIAGVFSLFGIVPLFFTELAGSVSTAEDWKYMVLVGYPFHLDALSWAKSSIILLFFLIAFCALFMFQKRAGKSERTLIFFISFLAVLFIFFCGGLVLTAFGKYELLRYMPMRLFPLFAPLFFLFTLAKAYQQKTFSPPANILTIVGLFALLAWTNPFAGAFSQIRENIDSRRPVNDGAAECFVWIRENTENGTVAIAPPWRNDFWYLSNRAEVINLAYAPVSNIGAWRERLDRLAGSHPFEKGLREKEEMRKFYLDLSETEVINISKDYGARILVSETEYPFPKLFQNGKYKVYRVASE